MKRVKIIVITQIICSCCMAQSITPDVTSTGGGDTTNSNVGLSWTIGELVGETLSGSNAKITQGFHQKHFEIVSLEEHQELGYSIKVYPNPSTDIIHVDLEFIGKLPAPSDTNFDIILRDNTGKVLTKQSIKSKLECIIPMQDYAAGQYFLQITGADGNLYKSAQITKLK